MKTIDTRGLACPAPLIATKRAIKEAESETQFEVIIDNDTACQNLTTYLQEIAIKPTLVREGALYKILFSLSSDASAPSPSPATPPTQARAVPTTANYTVAISTNKMGRGDDELGELLMRAFVNSLIEADPLPSHIILYNSGVQLAVTGIDTAQALLQLEEKGVVIIACGTCVDFFDLKEKMAVGKISNMYTISQILANTGHIIYP